MSEKDVLGSALAELAGPLKDFAEKLGGEEGPQWLEAFKRFLRKEEFWPRLQVWKTINLGTGLVTPDDFRRVLCVAGGFKISNWANDILGKSAFVNSVAKRLTEVDLCIATTAQLIGKAEGGTTREVFACIKRLGGILCPAEVGPQLRLQYLDQPNGEQLLIAMNPIISSDGDLHVFSVERHASGLWLHGDWGLPGSVWNPDYLWVFVRPRK